MEKPKWLTPRIEPVLEDSQIFGRTLTPKDDDSLTFGMILMPEGENIQREHSRTTKIPYGLR